MAITRVSIRFVCRLIVGCVGGVGIGVGGTLGSLGADVRDAMGTLGSGVMVIVASFVGLKRDERWMSCYLV